MEHNGPVPAAVMRVWLAACRAVSLSPLLTGRLSPDRPFFGRRIGVRDVTDRLSERAWPSIEETRGIFPVVH